MPTIEDSSKKSNSRKSFLSSVNPMLDAMRELLFVVTTRWRLVRSFRTRVVFAFAAYVFTIIAGLAINAGALFADLATYSDSEESVLARVWLGDISQYEFGLLGISFVATGFGIALLAPFTGASSLTLIDDDSAMPFSFTRGRRFFDSITFAAISGVGLVHFIVTVLTASLLSVDGSRLAGTGVALLLWMAFLALASVIGWLAEVAVARFGVVVKWLYGGVITVFALLAYTQESIQGVLLEAANGYGVWVRAAAQPEAWWSVPLAYLSALATVMLVVVMGFFLARYWDNMPPHLSTHGARRTRTLSSWLSMKSVWSLIVKVLWRTREVKRTLIAVSIAGSISSTYFFTTSPDSIIAGLMIGVPAISMLIWPSNAFGIFGSGLTWMLSQPKIKTTLTSWLIVLSVCQTAIVMLFLLIPLYGFHSDVLLEVPAATWATGYVNLILLPAIAAIISIKKPHTVRLTGRGESILPPAAAIGYLVGFGGVAAIVSALVTAFAALGTVYLILAVGLFTCVSFVLMGLAIELWKQPTNQQKVLFISTGD